MQGNGHFYLKTIPFYDINYQLALAEDKKMIFVNYCDFLNYFDPSVSVRLSFMNQRVEAVEYEKNIDIPAHDDSFNNIQEEYRAMLQSQLAKGNNGMVKTKHITFGEEADDFKTANDSLERIEKDVLNNFKEIDAKAYTLGGMERL